jgi:hypothetical protein
MSDIINKDPNMNELKFAKSSIGISEFAYSINKSSNEIIVGEDNLIKVILLDKLIEREKEGNKEVEKIINCIIYENNKIFYNQEEKLYMCDYSTLSNECLLTTLSSNISKILYNTKYNYVICYDEDDNIHIIDIESKKVNQYKSENKCSIKTGIISKNQKYLILLGTDGQLTVYEFSEINEQKNTALNIKNRIKNFLPKNILENKNWNGIFDTNNKNILISGGEALLKIVDLNKDELKFNSSTDFTCVNDINYAKFINDDYIVIIDIKNTIKIFNFNNKKLIMKLVVSQEEDEHILENLDFLINKENKTFNIKLIYGDNGGNLYISDNISISGNNNENLDDKIVDELFNELDEENKDDNEKKSKKEEENDSNEKDIDNNDNKSKKSEEKMDQADLSVLEDSEGNLLGKEEIEQKIREKQNNVLKEEAINNVKNIDIDTLKERLGLIDIQEPFISGSTSGMDNIKSRYILCNLVGTIISKDNNGVKTITINFSDISDKKNISFINSEEYIIGAMNEIGVLLGNHIEEENLDAYEKEDRRKNASILFKPILNKTMNLMSDWKKDLPQEENSVLLTLGSDWCCAYTSMSYLRIYSIFGSEKITLSLSNTVIALSGYENYLAYVYISSLPLSNSQQLRFKILDEYKMFNEVYDGILSISPFSNLIYFSYSKEGILISYDSYNIVRGFFYEVQNNWVPLLDLGNKYLNDNKNFWCIGVEDNEIYGIEMKGEKIEPYPESRPIEKTWNLITDDPENEFQKSYFFISFDEKRCNKYNEIRKIREDNILFPDYKLTESLKEDNEIKKQKVAHDKKIIEKMQNLAIEGMDSQVIVLFDYIFRHKNKEIFIKMCRELDKNELADYLSYKLNISQIIQKQNINTGGTIIQYVQEPTTIKKKKDNDDEKSENNNKKSEENEMISFAFDVDAYQKNMNEMKKDLKKEGFINDEKKPEKKDIIMNNEAKEENNNLEQNNSVFKNANSEEKEKENNKDMFTDLKNLASTSPIKAPRKSADIKPNQIVQKKGKKRTHKEIGEIEKRPKKANK